MSEISEALKYHFTYYSLFNYSIGFLYFVFPGFVSKNLKHFFKYSILIAIFGILLVLAFNHLTALALFGPLFGVLAIKKMESLFCNKNNKKLTYFPKSHKNIDKEEYYKHGAYNLYINLMITLVPQMFFFALLITELN